jgi:hypothetical protein
MGSMNARRLVLVALVASWGMAGGCLSSVGLGGVGTALAASGPSCANALARSEQGSAYLPDCRAYELVSPPNKKGSDVAADSTLVRAAAAGSVATFPSLGGFGDVQGIGFETDYLSERSSDPNPGNNGWVSHAITPHQEPLTLFVGSRGLGPGWQGDFSSDLSHGVFRAWSPVTSEDPNVTNVENLYVRDDLRTPGEGHYRLATPCPACSAALNPFLIFQTPEFISASADFSHVLFQSSLDLTPDAAGSPNVYEWVNGTLRLAGILPGSACGSPPCYAAGSTAGGEDSTLAMSSDGSRIVFTDTSTNLIYERIDGTTTVPVNLPNTDATGDGSPEATYQTSSTDGTRVFFTSYQQLTSNDTNSTEDLYMWDANAPDGHQITRISVATNPSYIPGNQVSVLGVSADGNYVYFTIAGQLVAGQPLPPISGNGIYVWHEGVEPAIAYVGPLVKGVQDVNPVLVTPSFRRSRVTPDGKHFLFASPNGEGLLSVHGGTDIDQSHCGGFGCEELYLYNADTNGLVCVSCGPSGAPVTASADTRATEATGGAGQSAHLNHSLSDDGRFVFFETAMALVPQDTNGQVDAYEYDAVTGNVYLLSSGESGSPSYFMDASSDGSDAFIFTRQRLSGWDIDGAGDLYDVRINGGFPEPPAAPAGCQGDACQPAPLSLNDPTPSSANFTGLGNPTIPGVPVVKTKSLTRAQRLARAMSACREKSGRKRIVCETRARKRYGGKRRAARRSMSHKGGK